MEGDTTELTEEQEKLPVALATFGSNSTSVFDDWGWGGGEVMGGKSLSAVFTQEDCLERFHKKCA